MSATPPEQIYPGTPVSRGIAMGCVYVVGRGMPAPEVHSVTEEAVPREIERYHEALVRTAAQLEVLRAKIESAAGTEEGLIFDSHLMMVQDPTLISRVEKAIVSRRQNAEFCFYAVVGNYLEAMRRVTDPYLRDRTSDIEDVAQRVLRNFSDENGTEVLDGRHILVAFDLNPSDTASMDRNKVLGFVTETGSVNSHTAILARALGIPAIVGLEGAVLRFSTLTPAILDGYTGKFILHPCEETKRYYQHQREIRDEARSALEALRDQESTTLDGRHLTLSANFEFVSELELINENRAEGIGLFRTEFFLLEGPEPPSETQQTEIYREVARGVQPHGVIIRTLDAGGDKLQVEALPEPEPNPSLGWRGIRVSLSRPSFFKEQCRAILRASAVGKVGIMFPLISGVTEVLEAKKLVHECMDELRQKHEPFDENLEIGAMIEVPSAAMMANEIAKHVDFFSFGTNDLIQYTLAVDRGNNRVASLYKPTHPAVLRLMKLTTEAAERHGIWTGVCGEMAGDLLLTPLLVGLGVDELSVGSREIPQVRKAILSLNYSRCREMTEEALTLPTSAEILQRCRTLAEEAYPELLV